MPQLRSKSESNLRQRKCKGSDDVLKPVSKDDRYDLSHLSLSGMRVPLKHISDVTCDIRRDYIESGYLDCEDIPKHRVAERINYTKTSNSLNCLESSMHTMLSCHNETGNIYTHLIPGVTVFVCLISEILEVMLDSNEDRVVMLTFIVSLFACFAFSSAFHITNCVVPSKNPTFLTLDLLGIFSLIIGSYDAGIYIAYRCHFFWKIFYLAAVNSMICFVMIPMLLIWPTYFEFETKKIAFAFFVGGGLIPAFHYTVILATADEMVAFGHTPFIMLSFYGIGFIFFHYRIPERWFPKTFDYVGHSHQIWHLFSTAGGVYWWYALQNMVHWQQENSCPATL